MKERQVLKEFSWDGVIYYCGDTALLLNVKNYLKRKSLQTQNIFKNVK